MPFFTPTPGTPAPNWERFRSNLNVGAHVLAFHELDSTMDVAWALAEAGARHGTVVRADVQRAGRGRFARRWEGAPGHSLLTSTVLRMPPQPVDAPISVAGTLAIFDCVSRFVSGGVTVKWPNDVLIEGRKVAGVLVESRVSTNGTGASVVGIGLNVNLDTSRLPEIAETATSLAAHCGRPLDLEEVEDVLFEIFDGWASVLKGSPDDVISAWRSQLSTLGQPVAVHSRDGVVVGVAEDVDDRGRLLLRDARGGLHTMAEGDVTLRA